MSLDSFRHVIEEIKPMTNYLYLHVKGEPLLHPDLDSILTICDEALMKVNITTNGTLMQEAVSILSKHPCLHQCNLSLHAEQNDPDYLERVFASVKKLSPDVLVIYRLWTLEDGTLNQKSTETVEKISSYYQLSTEMVEKLKKELHVMIEPHLFVDKQNQFEWPIVKEEQQDGYCYGLKTHIGILADGTVIPCCLDGEGIIALGNIFEEPLEKILSNERSQKMIEGFQKRCPSEALCRSCTYKNRF